MKKIKNIHILIIIAGILFNCISIFHPNLWFDEAYSVGLADKSFIDIWKIGGNDVHPILYYWILHIIYLITHSLGVSLNGTIIAYRVFSALCISILGILGFTHIRKDFGEKVGALFSFFSYFLPVICIYAAEVRMYSLAIVLVTALAIYAYRLFKGQTSIKNWIIFGLTSLACIYVHYYGLMAAGIINCVLLFYFIKEKKTDSIIKIVVSGVIQLLAYIPWIMYFMKQLKNVSKGFWIGFEFPKTIYQILGTQFSGNLKEIIGFIAILILYGYLIYRAYKAKKSGEEYKVGVTSIAIYFSVIIAALVITAVMKTSILYFRYLFVITGLFIFFISYFLGKEKNKYILGTIIIITLGLSIWSNYLQIKEAYEPNNMTQIAYLKDNIKPDDVIVFDESNFGTGSVVALNFTSNKQFYYNPSNWGVEAAYRAFGDQLTIYTNTDFLNECNGRIWIIDSENSDYYNKVFNNENYKEISRKLIKTGYEDYTYNMILVEKIM
ncbi:MAG: glycosyltransferase family 39 protein [Clostridia bacterium]|nr:glycosyltransferase family 39 protein [Clostridia bacterium]